VNDEERTPDRTEEESVRGRSMRGAARDLSSLFGDESDRGLGGTALGKRPARPGGASTGEMSERLSVLEHKLDEAVSRIESVDRHLATTFQALQELVKKAPDRDLFGDGGSGEALLDRIENVVADRVDRLSERLTGLEVQLREGGLAERLGALEERVGSTLSHAELSREAVERLERSVESIRRAVAGSGETVVGEAPAVPLTMAPEPDAESGESPEEPSPGPERESSWMDRDPVAELDALLGAPYDAPEPASPDPEGMFWSSEPEAGDGASR